MLLAPKLILLPHRTKLTRFVSRSSFQPRKEAVRQVLEGQLSIDSHHHVLSHASKRALAPEEAILPSGSRSRRVAFPSAEACQVESRIVEAHLAKYLRRFERYRGGRYVNLKGGQPKAPSRTEIGLTTRRESSQDTQGHCQTEAFRQTSPRVQSASRCTGFAAAPSAPPTRCAGRARAPQTFRPQSNRKSAAPRVLEGPKCKAGRTRGRRSRPRGRERCRRDPR